MKIHVYCLFDPAAPEVVQYVGQTSNLPGRHSEHCRANQRGPVSDWVQSLKAKGYAPGIRSLCVTDEINAGSIEALQIAQLDPPLNRSRPALPFNFTPPERLSLAAMEGRYIRHVLEHCEGNKRAAAKALGIGRQTLYNKLAAHEIA